MRTGKPTVTPSVLEKVVHLWIQETYGDSIPSVDQIVESFREDYPEYKRYKLQRFTRMVRQFLNSSSSNRKQKSSRKDEESRFIFKYDDDEDDNTSQSLLSPVRKKVKKFHNREQRLQMAETKQADQRQIELKSSLKSSSSDDGEVEGEEDRSAVSTVDDKVCSMFEPEFDLTKSMLRTKYSGSKLVGKVDAVDLMTIDRVVKPVGKAKNNISNNNDDDFDLNGKTNNEGVDANGRYCGPMFKDLGGMDIVLNELKKRVIIPLLNPELPLWLGVRPTLGILLHGPPRCGKTTLARAIANETGFPLFEISATELVTGTSGASEENIRELLSKAYRKTPSIVFIDEIEVIASKRENLQREMERRIVTQLMVCMDQSHRVAKNPETCDNKPGYVLVIGTTNRPDALDPALRRPGRFDHEINLGVPNEIARFQILKVRTRDLTVEGDFDLLKIARMTPGFVAADLEGLVNEAGNIAMERIIDERELELSKESEENENWCRKAWTVEELKRFSVKMLDMELAVKRVQSSSKREGFSSIPNVKWEDVGGLDKLRWEFDRHIVRRIKYPDEYEKYGADLETGFLLYGPPGCGKTLIAKAVANEAGANFIHIKGPELLNKYVGESELAVRTIFSRARTCSPCILFFDEVDALTTKRGKEGGWVVERLLNQLLVELDGADQRKGVYVIGATNRPEVMDQALLRPGRFGKLLYVPLPNENERGLILKALGRNKPLDADVDLIAIGRSQACANFSGADLCALINEAAMAAVEEKFKKIEAAKATTGEPQSSVGGLQDSIKAEHFERVWGIISPSVSAKQNDYHRRVSESFGAS